MYTKVCPQCGKEFETKKWNQIHCTMHCRALTQWDEKGRGRKKFIKLICETCKKEFFVTPCRKRRFCSPQCIPKTPKGERIKFKCQNCGKIFEVKPHQLKRPNKYCSWQCFLVVMSKKPQKTWIITENTKKKMKRRNTYNRGHTQKYSRYVMEQYLGRELKKTEIVHHKDFNSLNDNIDNLQIVTRHEHLIIHGLINDHRKCI